MEARLIDPYEAILFDLDGTLYRGDQVIPGAAEVVSAVRRSGRSVVFLTNNSGRSRSAVAAKLAAMGIDATPEEVVSSAVATAETLAERGVRTVFAACGQGLREELEGVGIVIADAPSPVPDAVVVGFDQEATYGRLRDACLAVQAGAPLIASNADVAFPAADGLWPGAGALLGVITSTTGATPEIIGKPAAPLFQTARRVAGGGVPLVVGDRVETDIAGAAGLGWDSLLVLSGVAQDHGSIAPSEGGPTWVGDDVSALFRPGVRP